MRGVSPRPACRSPREGSDLGNRIAVVSLEKRRRLEAGFSPSASFALQPALQSGLEGVYSYRFTYCSRISLDLHVKAIGQLSALSREILQLDFDIQIQRQVWVANQAVGGWSEGSISNLSRMPNLDATSRLSLV